jgi:hypothetical protein
MRFIFGLMILIAVSLAYAQDNPSQTIEPLQATEEYPFFGEWDYQFLIPSHYEDLPPAEMSQGWLALRKEANAWVLEPAIVQATPTQSYLSSAENNLHATIISSEPEARAFFRNLGFQAGKVEVIKGQADFGDLEIHRRKPLHINLGKKRYRIFVKNEDIFLSDGKRQMRLQQGGQTRDQDSDLSRSSSVAWAGDLDRDGKLDLIMNYSAYEALDVCLYLSSKATSHTLVGEVSCVNF